MLVDMERSYITAGFFRYTMHRRFSAAQQSGALQRALAKNNAAAGSNGRRSGLGGLFPGADGQVQQGVEGLKQGVRCCWAPCLLSFFLNTTEHRHPRLQTQQDGAPRPGQQQLQQSPSGRSLAPSTVGGMNLSSLTDPTDYKAGHLDKKVPEDSARGMLPVQGWRWQKRYFIVSDTQRALFYFKSEGAIWRPPCVVG
jgi:hypothetical protein